MSEASAKTGGSAPPSKDDSYGPDRTLVQVADWLTENAAVIDAVFASMQSTQSLVIKQCEFEEGCEVVSSNVLYSYITMDRAALDDDEIGQTMPLRRLKLLAGPKGEGISQHCVLDGRPYFLETFMLTLNRDSTCQCVIRYHAFSPEESLDHEMIEQYFDWRREDDQFQGVQIELKLWSPYIPAFLKGSNQEIEALRANPALIRGHGEVVHFRDEGFRPLFLMRRPPDRVELGKSHISLVYVGENQALRSPRRCSAGN